MQSGSAAGEKSKCERLTAVLRESFLEQVDNFLFDCDGVLWRGDQAVPGAPEVLDALRRRGKRVFFVSNNSTRTRDMYVEKLAGLGFRAARDEVFATAYCTAQFLKRRARLRGKVYLVGGRALGEELAREGIAHLGAGADPVSGGMKEWAAVALDPEVSAVVVGFDEHFSYLKLTRALRYLSDPDCLFVATNTDTRLPLEGGTAIPDCT
uniref:Phosphoglycolate phosphatase n=1 Tax=Latimeria chalumnae TaxID=7897 RepID=H3AG72_LATCH